MPKLNPLTLAFPDAELEASYIDSVTTRSRKQRRTAVAIGIFCYLLFGLLDAWFVPPEMKSAVQLTRLTALCVPILVLILSFTSVFDRIAQPLLISVSIAAGLGIIGMQLQIPVESAAYYYPMIVVVTFYTYNFVGVSFAYALFTDLFLLASYNIVFGAIESYPSHILITHDIYIISANIIGGTAGYIAEHQRRTLYLQERELDAERKFHLERSLHDGLTGLPNRQLLHDRIGQAIAQSKRSDAHHCGFFLDLDGFKAINDQLGHKAGDAVLKQVAERLSSCVRQVDTVARIGGDEFFVLTTGITSEEDASKLARKMIEQVKMPIAEIPEDMSWGTSIGICMFPYEDMSILDIMNRADKAMYDVKARGKGSFAFAKP